MKKITKALTFISTMLLTVNLASCNTGETFPIYDGSRTEYYNSNWKPSEKAIKNAVQPKIKNPKGITNNLNEIRRSQDAIGLPSLGKANILVVPITFKGDKSISNQIGYDLSFSSSELESMNTLYFGTNSLNEYPTVKDYYYTSSYGKLSLSGVISPVVEYPEEFFDIVSRIAAGNVTYSEVHHQIMEYVYNYLFKETETYYIGDFDSDNDRRIDNIQFLLNYPVGLQTGDTNADNAIYDLLNYENVYFHKDYPYSTAPVNSYVIHSEYTRKIETGSGNNLGKGTSSHIAINQTGLVLGLDNYADITGNYEATYYRAPMGYLDMMDGYVGDHNAFSKYQLGWINPKTIKASDIPSDGLVVTLKPSATSSDALVLYTGEHNMFSEYLILDYYTLSGVNKYDAGHETVFGTLALKNTGVRVLKVDARLLQGYGSTFYPFEGKLDFNSQVTLSNGIKTKYVYDYMNTNNGINDYYNVGITTNNPLVTILDTQGLNRHMTDASILSSILYDSKLVFTKGDTFGSDDQISGFYKDFAFNGDNNSRPTLDIQFEIKDITKESATIKLWGVK